MTLGTSFGTSTVAVHDVFLRLRGHPSGHAYTAAPISRRAGAYLAVDRQGRPSLFLKAIERSTHPPLRTAQVSLQVDQEYDLASVGAQPMRERFHALCCEATDAAGIDTFLVLLDAFLSRSEPNGLNAEVLSSFFRSLVRLFAVAPARDLRGERQGLWGELFVMSRVRGYAFWVPFWHTDPTRRFDFSSEGRRVEVKSSVADPRIHHFSHRQVYALPEEEIMIASLILREEDAGLSLRRLIDDCRATLRQSPHYLKLERSVRRAAMEDESETGPTFDSTEAERQLAWIRSTDAPHFRVPEPPGVFDTRYRVDLSLAPPVGRQDIEAWLDSWSAAPAAQATSPR